MTTELGKGGFGKVYEGVKDGVSYAVKVMFTRAQQIVEKEIQH